MKLVDFDLNEEDLKSENIQSICVISEKSCLPSMIVKFLNGNEEIFRGVSDMNRYLIQLNRKYKIKKLI